MTDLPFLSRPVPFYKKLSTYTIRRIFPLNSPLQLGASLSMQQKILYSIKKLAQSLRLMVGVHDYQIYLHHMRLHHPQQTPMSEKDFYRYCMDARFPGKNGKVGKCPC